MTSRMPRPGSFFTFLIQPPPSPSSKISSSTLSWLKVLFCGLAILPSQSTVAQRSRLTWQLPLLWSVHFSAVGQLYKQTYIFHRSKYALSKVSLKSLRRSGTRVIHQYCSRFTGQRMKLIPWLFLYQDLRSAHGDQKSSCTRTCAVHMEMNKDGWNK